jgi:hypothetical protein
LEQPFEQSLSATTIPFVQKVELDSIYFLPGGLGDWIGATGADRLASERVSNRSASRLSKSI